MSRIVNGSKKVTIAIVGGTIILVGLVLVPYPGPGWLIVFGGLAVLSSEFEFADKLLTFAKQKYDDWLKWLERQKMPIRLLVIGSVGLVTVLTLWLLNAFGLMVSILSLPLPWLISPLFS